MIRYTIATGELSRDGAVIGAGYSGLGDYKNDPNSCDQHDRGPIPPGRYTIGEPHDSTTHGPFAMSLTPDPANEMYGRSAFMIHGDSAAHPGAASNGCIIMPRPVREAVHESGDRDLEVVP